MKTVILAALLASVVSALTQTGVESHTESPWQVGKQYRYDVQSFTLSRLPEGASSGRAFRATFIVRVKAPGHLQARLEKPEHSQFHQQLQEPIYLPKDLKYEEVLDLEQPFEIMLEGGRVKSLNMPSSLSVVNENLLKGLIGTLQVDLSPHRALHDDHNTFDRENYQGQFRKMETDVTGDCVTLYTVSPAASEWRRELPKLPMEAQAIEITKSKNYGHCHHRVSYHFGVPNGAEWTGTAKNSMKQQFIKRASNSRILIGKQGPIYKAETTHTINVHPHMYGQQKAEVLSNVRLTLNSYDETEPPQWEQPENQRVIKNLLYSMNSKPMPEQNRSEESNELNNADKFEYQNNNRIRRSLTMAKKTVAINKVYVEKSNEKKGNIEDSSSSDSTSSYVNDEFPEDNQPAYAALYMNPQVHKAMKSNSANAQKLVQEGAQLLQNINNLPKSDFLSKFNILVNIISAMDSDQLAQTSRSIETVKNSNNVVKADMWMIFRDAVAQAGSLPAFKQIVSWIENKKIQGEEAAQVVATLAKTLRYPTKKVMIQFFELAMKPEVAQQEYLNSTALIAAAKLINMGQVNNITAHSRYPTHMYGRLSHQYDNFVLEDILPRLRQSLEQSIQQKDSRKAQVYIKALGLLGHRSILDVFTPYLEGKIPVSTYLRALMVDSLYNLAREKDSYTRVVLYSILRNTAEPDEIRVAAAQNIFIAHPTTGMMQGMAQMTHDDPSIQVRAVLKSSIRSAAQMKDPRHMRVARVAQAAESMLTKEKFGKQFSLKNITEYFDSDYELGIIGILSTIGSKDSLFPKYLRYSARSQTGGWQTIAASVSSIHQLAQKFQEYMYMWQKMPQEVQNNHKYSASKVSEMMNIKRDAKDPLEAAFYINLMNQERYFSFDEDDLNKLPTATKKLIEDLAKGVEVHYTKVLNQAKVTVMFPVAMGMPFVYKYREPTVVHIQSKAKGEVKLERNEQFAAIQGEIQFTYARNIDGKVGFLDTLSSQFASAGIVNKVQLNIPVKFDLQMRDGQLKIHLEPLRPEQDTTLVHYSVWPYTANQKKGTLTPISLDPTTKLIERNEKVVSMDYRFGQTIGSQYQLQGYSYSSDYRNLNRMVQSPTLSNIILSLYQRDVASTHFNFKYLGTKSQNKGLTVTAAYETHYNIKDRTEMPLTASKMDDVAPNSPQRRAEMVKRVASGIKSAKARIVDLSASFDGLEKTEYVLTAAIAGSPVDQKIQYAFFATKNNAEGNNQINGVGKVNRPQVSTLSVSKALERDFDLSFEFDIKYGASESGNINIKGKAERTNKYTEALQRLQQQKNAKLMSSNGIYRPDGYKMIVLAQTPDRFEASVTYKDVTPAVKYAVFQTYKMVEQFTNWNADVNPLKTTPEGTLQIEIQNNYLENFMNIKLNSKYGEVKIKNMQIHPATPGLISVYVPLMPHERLANFFTGQLYQPYCFMENGNKKQIKTFSHRFHDYTLSKSWHVVMQDGPKQKPWEDELVVLARKRDENKQDVYISYISETGQDMEIEIQDSHKKPKVHVKTTARKTLEGDLTMYWDETDETPFLQYFVQPDGLLALTIRENRLKVAYNGEKLVLLTRQGRNNTRGICGLMSGDHRDDYLTPVGLVDYDKYFIASYALKDNADQQTLALQEEAKEHAYQREYQYTNILHSDSQWQKWQEEDSSESNWEDWSSKKVFRSKSYLKHPRGNCVLSGQVQYYETASDICITMTPLEACASHCRGENYKVQSAQVVCRAKENPEFQQYVREIRQGGNPMVAGVPQIRQYRVPSSCRA